MNKKFLVGNTLAFLSLGITAGYLFKSDPVSREPANLGSAARSGVEFTLTVAIESFDLTVRQTYGTHVSLDNIIEGLTGTELGNQVSDFVVKVEKEAYRGSMNPYYLSTKVQAKVPRVNIWIKSWARSICNEARTNAGFTRSCKMDLNHDSTGDYFKAGGNSVSCGNSPANRLVCTLRFWGTPKAFKNIAVRKTPEELALSGARQTLMDTSAIFQFLEAGHAVKNDAQQEDRAKKAVAAYRATILYKEVEKLRFDGDYVNAGEGFGARKLIRSYSEITGQASRSFQ